MDRPETRRVVEGDHLEYHGEDQHEQKVQYLSCYTNVPKKEGGMFDILIRFALKKRGLV